MAMEGLGEHCSQLIQTLGDNIGSVSLAATPQKEVCFDGNIDRTDRFHACTFPQAASMQVESKSWSDVGITGTTALMMVLAHCQARVPWLCRTAGVVPCTVRP